MADKYVSVPYLIHKINEHKERVKTGIRDTDDIYGLAHEHIIDLIMLAPEASVREVEPEDGNNE